MRAKELPASFTAIAGNGLGVPLGFEVTLLDEEFTRSSALGVRTCLGLGKHGLLQSIQGISGDSLAKREVVARLDYA